MAALFIRTEAREGRQIKASAIDWEDIEKNPREAKALITKSNLFGLVDWESLRADGMDPGAGFLVDRVYDAIGSEPSEDSPQSRRDYAIGLEELRLRLEVCRTPEEVAKALEGLRAEYEAVIFNETEQAAYDAEKSEYSRMMGEYRAYREEDDRLSNAHSKLVLEINGLKWDQEKRTRRGWKPDPAIDERIQKLTPQAEEAMRTLTAWRDAHPEMQTVYERTAMGFHSKTVVVDKAREHKKRMEAIEQVASARNKIENPLCRAWGGMGARFLGVLYFRNESKGSKAFRNHLATARAGKIKDWSWAEKEVARVATSTKQSIHFQLQVADRYQRVGGSAIMLESSAALKEEFNLREVEFGLWVAEDFNSAKFHTEYCGAAYADLADLLGVSRKAIGLKGQLAMGFGSRGHGAAGWRTTAPAASYIPRYRVTNLTKHAGGGTLGHEWFHALDNLLSEMQSGKASGEDDFATEDPEGLLQGPLQEAMKGLVRTMTEGNIRREEKVSYTGLDVLRARRNIEQASAYTYLGQVGTTPVQLIQQAKTVHEAVLAIKALYARKVDRNGNLTRSQKNNQRDWILIAAAHFGGEENGGEIVVKAGEAVSSFVHEATRLDGGTKKPYWSTTRELAARAFQAWCEDRLQEQGRQSDYLSWHADNKWYIDPVFGPLRPFPEGEERGRINRAFDELFKAIKEAGILQ
jgi:hypothetical protein